MGIDPLSAVSIERAYACARDRYADWNVDVDRALDRLARISLSIHCWQGDDVAGFASNPMELGGGLAVTGNYPGRARNGDELRADLQTALALIPGRHRVNLHASYAETGGQSVERNELGPTHFDRWVDWAGEQQLGLDFNPTFFAHRHAADGFTLSHGDPGIRQFWVEHGIACRHIGASFGRALKTPCITNFWIPDGYKDTPADRWTPRRRLLDSLDAIFADRLDSSQQLDAIEGKLFGIGSESYVVGSHEFYLGYAIERKKMLCLDAGHYHPTEVLADKISAVLCWLERILLHVSRGVRWDSDHIVTLTDEVQAIAFELARNDLFDRVSIGLDYFDASVNRVAAWVIGARSLLKAILVGLLEPSELLREYERAGDFTARLALQEEWRTFPVGSVWDYYCLRSDVPAGAIWLDTIKAYEKTQRSRV